jgi:hypothetical protein
MRATWRPSPRRAALLGAAVVSLLFPLLSLASPASAGPAASARPAAPARLAAVAEPDATNAFICTSTSETACWFNMDDAIFPEPETDFWTEIGDTSCATVTASCPFADTKLDSALIGHSIIGFEDGGDSSACADSDSGLDVSINTCSGSHAFYVRVDSGAQMISVGGANQIYDGGKNPYPADVWYVVSIPGDQIQLTTAGGDVNYNWVLIETSG